MNNKKKIKFLPEVTFTHPRLSSADCKRCVFSVTFDSEGPLSVIHDDNDDDAVVDDTDNDINA